MKKLEKSLEGDEFPGKASKTMANADDSLSRSGYVSEDDYKITTRLNEITFLGQHKNDFKIKRRRVKIIRDLQSSDNRLHTPMKENIESSINQRDSPSTKDIVTENIEIRNSKLSHRVQTVSRDCKRSCIIKSEGIETGAIIIDPNKPFDSDKCNKTLYDLKRGRCYACYYKYINSIEGRRQIGFITPGSGPFKILPFHFRKTFFSIEPKKTAKSITKNIKSPFINPLKKPTVVKNTKFDWSNSKLFKRLTNNEYDAWNIQEKNKVFTETDVATLLSHPLNKNYKRIRSKLERTILNLCDSLNINFSIDSHNMTKAKYF